MPDEDSQDVTSSVLGYTDASDIDNEDGRHARAERGRRLAVEATVRLLARGEPLKSIDQVAEESGIPKRTLFRYFGNVDGIVRELFGVYLPTMREFFADSVVTNEPLESRVRRLLMSRFDFVKRFGHMSRTIDRIASEVPTARQMKELREGTFRRQTDAWLSKELQNLPLEICAQVELLTSFNSISHMYEQVGESAVDALCETIIGLMSPINEVQKRI
jgi:AcrR family transcriptional regulator